MFFNTSLKHTTTNLTPKRTKVISVAVGIGLCTGVYNIMPDAKQQQPHSYIISADNYTQLQQYMAHIKVEPTHKLAIIKALAVSLTDQQLADLKKQMTVKVTENYQVELSGQYIGQRKWQPEATVPTFVEANQAHASANYGGGVTIGFLDTGLDSLAGLGTNLYGQDKYWGTYDAINDIAYNYYHEANGHGTHVSSVAGNSDYDMYGRIYGVAPNALLVGIKAFDSQGRASYADVIRGIGWAVSVKDQINLRVLNMSFSGPARTYYWEDPLNQAVMAAWEAGIVVVASAGNTGPDPMTIGVPGNLPYIITVGAMTDNYTPSDYTDDRLANFSSTGPTYEGFVKPEILAPGGHMSGLMAFDSTIVTEHPEFHDGGRYFEMTGTSQAAAVVSGVAALLLTADPTLSPDDVKCRLMAGARTAKDNTELRAYSVFQQGAGVVSVKNALNSTASGCANQTLNIQDDIAGIEHYYGPAKLDADGNLILDGLSAEYKWEIPTDLQSPTADIWRSAIKSDSGFIWSPTVNGSLDWSNKLDTSSGFIWSPTITSVLINSTDPLEIAVNNWVEQQ